MERVRVMEGLDVLFGGPLPDKGRVIPLRPDHKGDVPFFRINNPRETVFHENPRIHGCPHCRAVEGGNSKLPIVMPSPFGYYNRFRG